MMRMPLPGLDDAEGEHVPDDLPPVVDAHVHLFPDRVFDAIWRWFDANGWPIRRKLYAPQIVDFLTSRGVEHLVALHYAHKPGMARALNAWMADFCRDRPNVTGLATVLPGEPGAREILEEAFAAGLRGVKLHCHVQCFSPDDAQMNEVYEACTLHDLPLVIHAGRAPASGAYACDPYAVCAAERVDRVLAAHPRLRLCVPHLGADEFPEYERLLERYDNLWLDTTMMLADYFAGVTPPPRLLSVRPERILYGTDFPNVPYAWDRELVRVRRHVGDLALERVMAKNARELYAIAPPCPR